MKRLRPFLVLMVLFLLMPVTAAGAATGKTGAGISDNLFDTKHEVTSDGSKAYYQIDVTSKQPGQDKDDGGFKNPFKTIGSWISGDAIKDTVLAQFYEGMNFVVNILFKVNVYMTNMMLTVLNYAYHFDVINRIIEQIEVVVQKITGISHFHFEQYGLYGDFLLAIGVSVGLAFIFKYFFQGAQLEATGSIAKSVLILMVALFFFTNYGTVLKGANNITTELTGHVIGASSGLFEGKGSDSTRGLGENMWNLFVHRPYLYMQYGNDEESAVGKDRVNALLKLPPGEKRQDYVEEMEVNDRSNMMMTYSMVPDRLVFTVLYTIVNGITSIPIFALALLLILFQFWFLTIAVAAPFYMVIAAFPGGGGVFRRYTEELALPLLLKIAVSVIALVVFTMSAIVYEVSNSDSIGYFATAFVEFIVLLLIFVLRKRFMRILMEGNNLVRSVAHEVSKFDHHVSNAARDMKRKATKAAAQAAGAAVAGPEGAAVAGAAVDGAMGDDNKSEPLENVSMDDDDGKEKDETVYADAELVEPGSNVVPYSKQAEREPDIIDMPLTRLSDAGSWHPGGQSVAEAAAASETPYAGEALPMLAAPAGEANKTPSRYRLSKGGMGRAAMTARRGQTVSGQNYIGTQAAANTPIVSDGIASPDITAGESVHREQGRATALPNTSLSGAMDKPIEQPVTVPPQQPIKGLVHDSIQQPVHDERGATPSAVPETVQITVPHGTRTAAPAVVSLGSRRQGGERRRQAKPEARSDSFRTARGSAILESLEMPFVSHETAPMTSQDNLIPRTGATELPSKNVSLEEDEGERDS